MSEQYYTPEITEFHVGFNYQMQIKKDIWEDRILGKEDLGHIFNLLNGSICFPDNIRVPYLTKEDIEAEGWVEKIITHDDLQGRLHFTKLSASERYEENRISKCSYVPRNNWLKIRDSDNYTRFSGTIRNKSEFNKLLKQLGI